MEVLQDSYKNTKIGKIPKSWEIVRLKELCIRTNQGVNTTTEKVKYVEGGTIPVIRSTNIFPNRITWENVKLIDINTFNRVSENVKPKKGDILYSNIGTIGNAALVDSDSDFIIAWNVFRMQLNNGVDNKFLMYFLNYRKNQIKRLETQSTLAFISGKEMLKLFIASPSIPEQQKIAEIISTVDKQISDTERIIEKSKELKKGLMQKLFSEGIGHTEFKDTKIGRIPMEWELSRIGSVADCSGGTTPSTTIEEYWNGNILWATPTDITSNNSVRLIETSRKITEEGRKSKNLKYVSKDGLLMTSRASIGFVKISNGDVTTNQGFINIECKNRIHYKYLYFWIIQNRGLLMRFSQGSTFLELHRTAFKKLPIPLPPLPEQQKIAEILSEADKKIEKEEQYKSDLEQLKKGLMQQLLTGQKRVKV